MRTQITHALSALVELSEDTAPKWIQMFPRGRFRPVNKRDKRGPWVMDDPTMDALIADFDASNTELAVDYDHQTLRAAANGQPAFAAGWIQRLEKRPAGLFALTDWTDEGRANIKSKKYRYFSPTFDSEGERILSLAPGALTNFPALDLPQVAASAANANIPPQGTTTKEPSNMDKLLKLLRAKYKLPEDASEEQIIAAIEADSEATKPEMIAANGLPDPAKYIELSAFDALAAQVREIKAKYAGDQVAAIVQTALSAGKLMPAQKDWATS